MSDAPPDPAEDSAYLTVRETAQLLHLNEKKIYALIQEGGIPATKVTGKWLFPRKLLDNWLLESTHGGALTDRLILAGSDDPLLALACTELAGELGGESLVALSPAGSVAGLELLAGRRANLAALHWGPADLADRQHRRLVAQFPGHAGWVLVRLYRREQGVLLAPGVSAGALSDLARRGVRWAFRQSGAGSQHFLTSTLGGLGLPLEALHSTATARSERHAGALLVLGKADCAPGVKAAAGEFGLGFLPLGWERFDLAVPRQVYFRQLFQRLLGLLASRETANLAASLGGYDLSPLGTLVSEGE